MAKYTKEEVKLLKVVATLRGLVFQLLNAPETADPLVIRLAMNKSKRYGARLPYYTDVEVASPQKASLTKEFDRGYRRGVKDAKLAMARKVEEIGNWDVPLLAHEVVDEEE